MPAGHFRQRRSCPGRPFPGRTPVGAGEVGGAGEEGEKGRGEEEEEKRRRKGEGRRKKEEGREERRREEEEGEGRWRGEGRRSPGRCPHLVSGGAMPLARRS